MGRGVARGIVQWELSKGAEMRLIYEVTSELAVMLAASSLYQTSETMNTAESRNDTADRRSGC